MNLQTRSLWLLALVFSTALCQADEGPPRPRQGERLALSENWAKGAIDPQRWYTPRKKWGQGNHGVVPENVRVDTDRIAGRAQHVLVCKAHGDEYRGDIVGLHGQPTRVGGLIVSKAWFASGRFEVVMKVGSTEPIPNGPADPRLPKGAVPAIWTYGYRYVEVDRKQKDIFVAERPLYNPLMPKYGIGANEYWSELDFPEYGKAGRFNRAMYNTFCQNRHQAKMFDVRGAADGRYHKYTTEWRTHLVPIDSVTDEQVTAHAGYYWVCDKQVPFEKYLGNPLKKLGPDEYAVYAGLRATHWIDDQPVAQNQTFVPAMAAQLNLGVWLPDWAGAAPWKQASVKFASIRVWQYGDPGDVRGILVDDLRDNFAPTGKPLAAAPKSDAPHAGHGTPGISDRACHATP